MIHLPIVSVIIPTYNRAHLIDKAINSVLSQTYQDYEIIIVDDASTDNTKEVVKDFTDSRISYIFHTNNLDISAARNSGIKASQGKYIALLDSDDEWLPEKLDKQINKFEKESLKIGVIYTGSYYIDEKGNQIRKVHVPIKEGYIYEDLLRAGGYLCLSSTLIKRECFKKVGLFDENLPPCEDLDMWIRIAKYYKFSYIKDLLVATRIHNNQITNDSEALIEGIKKIQVKYNKELGKRPYSNSIRYFHLGNKLCHLRKRKEGQKYFIKAISIYPFCIKYYVYLLCSIFGTRVYMYISRIRRYFMTIRKKDYC